MPSSSVAQKLMALDNILNCRVVSFRDIPIEEKRHEN